MSDEHPSEVLAGLPHTRPHRRSEKRAAPARPEPTQVAVSSAAAPRPATQRRPRRAQRVELIGSAVHLSAELAELGISAGARALRGVVARLPKP